MSHVNIKNSNIVIRKTIYIGGVRYTFIRYKNGDTTAYINYCKSITWNIKKCTLLDNREFIDYTTEGKKMNNKMTFNNAKKDERFVNFSEGNTKLKPTKDIKYLIFNLPAIKTCPFATDCVNWCYARKAEKMYPSVLPCREKNLERTKLDTFVDDIVFTIHAYMQRPSYKNAKRVIIRIHESGDFYDEFYFKKWTSVANIVSTMYGNQIIFIAYTKSPFAVTGHRTDNMIIRYSLSNGNAQPKKELNDTIIKWIHKYNVPVYNAVWQFTTDIEKQKCHCNDCSTCLKCMNSKFRYIECEIH